ncbi:MAG TPA: thiamine diphosphokinase, partial [Candidatus Limnocylindria bacterium]|nr:thiamine diphosphokinase [Candidatus Limnocylindria bacterium]
MREGVALEAGAKLKAVLVASGDPLPSDEKWLDEADLVVAVDGGAGWLASIGRRPDALVGDLDSVEPWLVERLEAEGVAVERHATEKDSSDTELALAHTLRLGADRIVVLGALGGERLDHELANVLLLAGPPRLAGVDLRLVRGASCLRILRAGGSLTLEGTPGSLVSLLPLGGDAVGVTTSGLRYALNDEPLHMGSTRGLSNVVAAQSASVQLRQGTVLVI